MRGTIVALWLAVAGHAQEPGRPFTEALSAVRAEPADLDVRPARWDTRLTSPAIEALLANPIELPGRAAAWGRRLAEAKGLAELAGLSEELLGLPTEPPRAGAPSASTAALAGVPEPVASAVAGIALAAARAKPFLQMASAGLSLDERERLSEKMLAHLFHGPSERMDPQLFELAARFDLAALLQAVRGVAEGVDRAAAALAEAPAGLGALPRSLIVAGSTVTLGGAGDDEYSAEELASSLLVLDLGGRNRYLGPPAAAGPGEIRLVLDLGGEVVIESSGPVATGRFGIGLLHLGNPAGAKRLSGGRFSLGAGLFGAGLLAARGDGSRFEGGDFSQGAGAFGLGLLDFSGASGSFTAPINAQGFGFTRGVGLLRVRGKGARLECGLVYPDPRDAVAAVSLCQGAGYGPRAFAAGGFGLARVESDDAQLYSNYFAQGLGYWHSFGGFYLEGDRALVQSRRYGQGAGIHTALGALELRGDENRLLHWGVGPGFGWDWGTGSAAVAGDRNRLYADWGSAKGDVNGHGLLEVEGSGNLIRLGEFATGALKRSAPSYGVVVVSGTANEVWSSKFSTAAAAGPLLRTSPWGAAVFSGEASLSATVSIGGPTFRPLDAERAAAAKRDREWNAGRLAEADRLPARERLPAWLFRAAEGGLEGDTPREALSRLLSLPDVEAGLLVELVAPERFDEFVYLRTLIPAYGRRIAPALAAAVAGTSGLRKALLLGFFRQFPAEEGSKAALAAASDPDWRVRREALGTLGSLFDRELGEEPGRVAFLEESLALCRRPDPRSPLAAAAVERIGQKRLSDLLAVLALAGGTAGDRVNLLLRAPDAFSPVPAETLNAYAAALGSDPKSCVAALTKELKDVKRLEAKAADRLAQAVDEASPDLLPVALAALGMIGRAKDAERLGKSLSGDTAFVREAAAIGLARLGRAALPALQAALRSPEAGVRRMAIVAAAQSTDPDVFRLVARGFEDPDESVRLTAVSAPSAAQAPLHKYRAEFAPALERLAAADPSPSVRASAR